MSHVAGTLALIVNCLLVCLAMFHLSRLYSVNTEVVVLIESGAELECQEPFCVFSESIFESVPY